MTEGDAFLIRQFSSLGDDRISGDGEGCVYIVSHSLELDGAGEKKISLVEGAGLLSCSEWVGS